MRMGGMILPRQTPDRDGKTQWLFLLAGFPRGDLRRRFVPYNGGLGAKQVIRGRQTQGALNILIQTLRSNAPRNFRNRVENSCSATFRDLICSFLCCPCFVAAGLAAGGAAGREAAEGARCDPFTRHSAPEGVRWLHYGLGL